MILFDVPTPSLRKEAFEERYDILVNSIHLHHPFAVSFFTFFFHYFSPLVSIFSFLVSLYSFLFLFSLLSFLVSLFAFSFLLTSAQTVAHRVRLKEKEKKKQIKRWVEGVLNENGEGVVLRQNSSPYISGRSDHLIKLKVR